MSERQVDLTTFPLDRVLLKLQGVSQFESSLKYMRQFQSILADPRTDVNAFCFGRSELFTPLMWAVGRPYWKCAEVQYFTLIQLLLHPRLDRPAGSVSKKHLTVRNDHGFSALDYASGVKSLEVAEVEEETRLDTRFFHALLSRAYRVCPDQVAVTRQLVNESIQDYEDAWTHVESKYKLNSTSYGHPYYRNACVSRVLLSLPFEF
jgi:hypothetical protein